MCPKLWLAQISYPDATVQIISLNFRLPLHRLLQVSGASKQASLLAE